MPVKIRNETCQVMDAKKKGKMTEERGKSEGKDENRIKD